VLWIVGPSGEERSLGLAFLTVMVGLVGGAAIAVIYSYPAVNLLPADRVVTAFFSGLPEVQTGGRPPHEAALLERGRYLYSVASCAYCHGSTGGGGGKVNWFVFGTTWNRNLTGHPTGLADWSDEAVLRALTSGVSRTGRALHWQAMIWDHLSNYTLEDQHALLAYVRTLPPLDQSSPPPVPPGAHDCAGDTFWLGVSNAEAGCD
jgi:hypothetical protein